MSIGVLYNTFVCFITGFFSLMVFSRLKEIRREKEKQYSEGLDYFALLLGLLWLFVGVRTFFVFLGRLDIDNLIFAWISGPLTYLHLLPLFFYFGWSFFPEKGTIRKLFVSLFSCIALAAVVTLFLYGFSEGTITYAGTDQTPNDLSNDIFTFGIFFPLFIFIISEFIRRFKKWRETKDATQRQLWGFSLGLLVYSAIGIFDALGIIQGWLVLLVRIGIMVAPLTFYLSATWE